MKKSLFLILSLISFLNAEYIIEKNKNLFLVKVNNSNFENDLLNLKDELVFNVFKIVNE